MELQQLRNTIKEIRGILKPSDDWKKLSATSQADYTQKFAALGGALPAQVAQCKSSYYGLRAAFLHVQSRLIRDDLNELDKWAKANGAFMTEAKRNEKISALGLFGKIDAYKAALAVTSFEGAAKGVIQTTHGKRKTGALPWGWKIKLMGAVPRRSKYKGHIAVMAACGARPSEFEAGIEVRRINKHTFAFFIHGKKTGERTKNGKTYTTGQDRRVVTLTRADYLDKDGLVLPEFFALEKAMGDEDSNVFQAKATALRDVVINASNKAFPTLENKPTAYSFRHAFAAELKAANGEQSDVTAAALGHASTRTQSCYGYTGSGRGGHTVKAQASGVIRSPRANCAARLTKKSKTMSTTANLAPASLPSPSAPKAAMPKPSPFASPFVTPKKPKPLGY
jgi:integrase